jgi:hypothetical protein
VRSQRAPSAAEHRGPGDVDQGPLPARRRGRAVHRVPGASGASATRHSPPAQLSAPRAHACRWRRSSRAVIAGRGHVWSTMSTTRRRGCWKRVRSAALVRDRADSVSAGAENALLQRTAEAFAQQLNDAEAGLRRLAELRTEVCLQRSRPAVSPASQRARATEAAQRHAELPRAPLARLSAHRALTAALVALGLTCRLCRHRIPTRSAAHSARRAAAAAPRSPSSQQSRRVRAALGTRLRARRLSSACAARVERRRPRTGGRTCWTGRWTPRLRWRDTSASPQPPSEARRFCNVTECRAHVRFMTSPRKRRACWAAVALAGRCG